MPKRKERVDHEADASSSSDESDTPNNNIVDIEFEFFDPAEIDFHGIKNLLRQLLDVDATLFDISALTNLIIEQKLLGSTVKVEGKEDDPYAFLTVLNLDEHKDKPCIQTLVQYLLDKSKSNDSLHNNLRQLIHLDETDGSNSELVSNRLGLILSERLLNMPVELVPPMYNMLLEEVQWAIEESIQAQSLIQLYQNEPYQFESYLILSKVYTEITSTLDDESTNTASSSSSSILGLKRKASKKQKTKSSKAKFPDSREGEIFYFHPEDEALQSQAGSALFTQFQYTNEISDAQADSKRAFFDAGIIPKGNMILLSTEDLKLAVKTMMDTYAQND